MSTKRMNSEQVCEPLDTYEEMQMFMQNPPSWRSLCEELKPHSRYVIRNMDVPENEHSLNFYPNNIIEDYNFECPKTFCHFTSGIEKVKRQEIKKLPKALVCHDMANGYHEDSLIDGSGRYEAYSFYNWTAIDTFCYFSHHLVTIPPLGWINVGHAHGVKVIGTVITEWNDGEKFWEEVLASEHKWKELASMLVAIAKTLKFDGWLLNVENKVSSPHELLRFVQFLHANLHAQLPAAQLIWYDSVTSAGELHWQNGLNQINKDWFDACDGIFTNYSWSERQVAASAALAGARLTDLYIGIDVWGRNFYGGGKFNTQQAIRIAHKYGCSLAIFAPAWTYEAIPEECTSFNTDCMDPGERFQHFQLRERAFWGSIWCYLNTKLPNELPFQTSFCRGQGLKRRLYGEVLCPVPWYNLRHMQYQPNSNIGPHGYLLVTVPKMLKVSTEGVLRDEKGDVKLRESFLAVTNEGQKSSSMKTKAVEDVKAQTSATTQVTKNAAQTKDSVKQLLLKILFGNTSAEDEESPNTIEQRSSAPPLSLSVSAKSKTDHLEFVLLPVPEETECLELYLEDSFIGGSCLKINTFDDFSTELKFIRIFQTDFYVEDTLVTCVVTKNMPEFKDQYLNLLLEIETLEGEVTKVILVGKNSADENFQDEIAIYPLNETPNADFNEVQKYLLLEEPGFYIPTYNSYEWDIRYFRVWVGGARVTSVFCRTGRGSGALLLGHLGFCHMVCNGGITAGTPRLLPHSM